jgi:hypothetical protein
MTENYRESFTDVPVAQDAQSGRRRGSPASLVYPLHLSLRGHEKILLASMLAIRRLLQQRERLAKRMQIRELAMSRIRLLISRQR